MNKLKLFGVVLILILIGGGIFLSRKNSTSQSLPVNQTISTQETNLMSPTPIATPSPTPVGQKTRNNRTPSASAISNQVGGQIVCDYQTPPDPTNDGTAKIESKWNGTNVDICVSANGGAETLMATGQGNGSREDDINWISLNVVYVFTLYSQHPEDPVCAGASLSSCRIYAPEILIPSPQPNGH